jgi:hypothetical protein
MDEVALLATDSLFREGATRTNETALMGETTSPTKPLTRNERAARQAQQPTSSGKTPKQVSPKPTQPIT